MERLFHFPNKETRNRKKITIICMCLIMISLYAVAYFLFLRTVQVDVTKDASIVYSGETKSATVKVENTMKVYNQRIQEFMDSISYEVNPSENLSNGDTITISATFDKELAHSYNIEPISQTRTVKVKNLPIRFKNASKIPTSYLHVITDTAQSYLDEHMKSILAEDFTSFYVDSTPALQEQTFKYRVFLNSKTGEYKDKIVDVYAIDARGEVNTSSDGETLEEKVETIYYMITFNEINTSLEVMDENIYGEKIILNQAYDFQNEEIFMKYMQTKYNLHYEVTKMEINKNNT